MVLKKLAGAETDVRGVDLGVPAIWIRGAKHVYMGPTLPPRYAGNVLLWQDGAVTFRLEGRDLTLAHARELARELLRR